MIDAPTPHHALKNVSIKGRYNLLSNALNMTVVASWLCTSLGLDQDNSSGVLNVSNNTSSKK